MFDNFINIRQTDGFAKFLTYFKWSAINPKPNVYYFLRRIPWLGSIIKIEKINVQNIDLAEIEKIARGEKALFVKIEPFADVSIQEKLDKLFLTYGYIHDSWPLTATATDVINLNQPYEKIVANFKSKFRYNLRLAKKKGLKVQQKNGVDLINNPALLRAFTNIFNQRARQIKSETHSFEELLHTCNSHGDNLYMVYISYPEERSDEGSPHKMIAAALFLFTKDICHYWHNGSTEEGRSLFAPTLIMAEGIKFAKERGCKIFDFEGIYDERFPDQTKRWKGFTRFKEGFGPEKIVFVRPYIKYYSPVFKFFHFFRMI